MFKKNSSKAIALRNAQPENLMALRLMFLPLEFCFFKWFSGNVLFKTLENSLRSSSNSCNKINSFGNIRNILLPNYSKISSIRCWNLKKCWEFNWNPFYFIHGFCEQMTTVYIAYSIRFTS